MGFAVQGQSGHTAQLGEAGRDAHTGNTRRVPATRTVTRGNPGAKQKQGGPEVAATVQAREVGDLNRSGCNNETDKWGHWPSRSREYLLADQRCHSLRCEGVGGRTGLGKKIRKRERVAVTRTPEPFQKFRPQGPSKGPAMFS